MELSQRHIYLCKVTQIKPTYLLVNFVNGKGICHISEISDYLVNDINKFFAIDQKYYFLLLNPNTADGKYNFSYRRINPKLLRWHYSIIPTITGFDNIYKNTMELIQKI